MIRKLSQRLLAVLLATCGCLLAAAQPVFGQGIYLSSAGPVNRSMGGASTAAPIDAIGSMYWNPATISALRSELAFGTDLIYANHTVASSLGPLSGATNSEPGVYPVPTMAWVHHTSNPAITFGLGVGGVAGFKTNVFSDPTNPVLTAPPLGLGRITSEGSFMQITPVVSIALADNLSISAGPVVTLGQLSFEPFVFDPPNTNLQYPSGRASRYHWGGGAQAGIYYIHNSRWHWGLSLKSPAWMEKFRFFSEDASGGPRVLHADVDLPMILSLGTAYSGWEDWILAADLRYFDYKNTDGLGDDAVFNATGELGGVGWHSVVAVATGVQRRINDRIYLRGGYTFTQSPIRDSESFFNIASPLIYEHMFSTGGSYRLTDHVAMNLAYSYMLPSEVTGPVVLPVIGAVPGSSVTNSLDVHILSMGVSVGY